MSKKNKMRSSFYLIVLYGGANDSFLTSFDSDGDDAMSDSVFLYLFGMPRTEVVRRLRDLADDLDQTAKRDDIGASSVVIYDWALAKRAVPCLIGRAKGHPTIEDGHPLFSSELYYLDEERGIARTLSRWYQLGNRLDPDSWNQRYGGRQ
ncbi:hypothetical protein [Sinorhizobium fredii]|uniref:hypothetical protein n=1 Tax=Rhizobium fredii TaxID=380 RepID=UPI001F0ABF90|nr:hypothetical protein [Sinorhizobium fredii]